MRVIIYIKNDSYINHFLETVEDYCYNHKGGYMMAKLNDIKGYWDTSYGCDFNYNDMWEGKILLEEDGWFEGIVVDPNIFYKKDRFIFGVYHPNKVIELFIFIPVHVDDSAPFVFHGTRDATGYDGTFEYINLLGSNPYGTSRIITRDAELTRGNVDSEIDELKSRIQSYKNNNMDSCVKNFYDNYIAIRKSICQIILRNFEGRGFTAEECQQIMEECQPVNDRVMQTTEKEVKKLVKIMPRNLFEDDDDDILF